MIITLPTQMIEPTETKIPTATFTFAGKRYAIRHKSKHEPLAQWHMFGTVAIFLAHRWATQAIKYLKTAATAADEYMVRHGMDYIYVMLIFGHLVFGATVGLFTVDEIAKSIHASRPFRSERLTALLMPYMCGLGGLSAFVALHLLCLGIGTCLAATKKQITAVIQSVDEVV